MTDIEVLEPLRGDGDLRLAVIVNPALSLGFLANTVATICIGLGAVRPGFGRLVLTDSKGIGINISADRPVPILQADPGQVRDLLARALSQDGLDLVVFPEFARRMNRFSEYEATFPERDLMEEPLDGIGLCGPSKVVKSLTGSLKLLR